jgi:small subunit ribosomal protein S20
MPLEALCFGRQTHSEFAAQALARASTADQPSIHQPGIRGRDGIMANTKSAKKAARQAVRRTEINKSRASRVRTAVRDVEDAVKSGNKKAAKEALKAAEPVLASVAQKGVIDKRMASRKVSRLSARVKAMAD